MDNWISVKDRLPAHPGDVLAYDGQCWVASYDEDGWRVKGITHWQPLPEPPTPPRSNATEAEGW